MKLFILSKGRSKTICTHKYLPEGQYKIVLHNKGEKKDYLKNSSVPPESIIVSDQPYNLPKQRNFVKFELAKKETWYGCFDDNIHGFQVHPEPFYSMDKIEQNLSLIHIY